ncbi:hypothetical protein ACFWYA_14630 [Streptomyces sp. NPDC059011]|uniref:hypothetical protein n=1 Tax=unclassified Streptomyces TaxID=2593676 RepID=UPI0036A9F6EA
MRCRGAAPAARLQLGQLPLGLGGPGRPVDLPVAATAEETGLTLLHHDRGFETTACATGQPVRTIDVRDQEAPSGTR